MWARFDEDGYAAWFGPEPIDGAELLEFGGLWPPDVLHNHLLTRRRLPDGSWVARDPVTPSIHEPTAEEIASRAAEAKRADDAARKLAGVEFEGVMCSATRDDQAGLTAVLLAIQMEGAAFTPTRFEFENGNHLIISLANYQAFSAVWRPFRKSFFRPEVPAP